jgi:threonine/homoserine/homoserine lactone efflux protein
MVSELTGPVVPPPPKEMNLPGFLGVAALIIVTPGPDTVLTIRNTLRGGRRAGTATAIGVAIGQITWALMTAAGLGALMTSTAVVPTFLRLLGGGLLVILGIRSVLAQPPEIAPDGSSSIVGQEMGTSARQGLLSNLGNPKMVLFFAGLLPAFVPAGESLWPLGAGLGALFSLMTLTWLTLYATAVTRAAAILRIARTRRLLDLSVGLLLIVFGLHLALARV